MYHCSSTTAAAAGERREGEREGAREGGREKECTRKLRMEGSASAPGGGMSFAQMAVAPKTEGPLECVQVDGMVLMRIARHCRESAPAVAGQIPVTGLLLGLDVGETLEVTNCFAFPNVGGGSRGGNIDSTSSAAAAVVEMAGADLDELAQNEGTAYQLEVLRCLREINVDSNTVGWYQSFFLDSFQTRDLVETFIAYKENIKRCVCIAYDPQCTHKGNTGFKALRLSEKFLELYKDGTVTVEGLDTSLLTWNDIFEEIPITVRNSVLVEAMMSDLADVGAEGQPVAATQDDYDRLDMSTNPFLMKNLDYLIESLDDYQREQSNLAQHQRNMMRHESQRAAWIAKRRAENAQRRAQGEEPLPEEDPTNPVFRTVAEPDRLELLLVNSQISNYCKQMETYSSQAMTKMQVLGSMKNE